MSDQLGAVFLKNDAGVSEKNGKRGLKNGESSSPRGRSYSSMKSRVPGKKMFAREGKGGKENV